MSDFYDTYAARRDKWNKFDELMHQAAAIGRDYRKFQKLRDALTPRLKQAEKDWLTYRGMWYDHAQRELEKEGIIQANAKDKN